MEMPPGEGTQILLEPVIARQMEHFVGLSPAAFSERAGNNFPISH